jgi:hypothetical protein
MACGSYIESDLGRIKVVLSSGRPTGALRYTGQRIFESNTGRELMYDGTDWTIMSGPVTTWAPAFASGVTVGNGTWASAWYHRTDGFCRIHGEFVLGTTTAVTGAVSLNLPVAAAQLAFDELAVTFFDASAGTTSSGTTGNSPTAPALYAQDIAGTFPVLTNLAVGVPFTWATGDQIHVTGRYRMTTRYS